MQSSTATLTTVDITEAELATIMRVHMASTPAPVGQLRLPPQRFQAPLVAGASPTRLEISFPMTAAQLDMRLRALIINLPAIGKYNFRLNQMQPPNPAIAAIVTWTTP